MLNYFVFVGFFLDGLCLGTLILNQEDIDSVGAIQIEMFMSSSLCRLSLEPLSAHKMQIISIGNKQLNIHSSICHSLFVFGSGNSNEGWVP